MPWIFLILSVFVLGLLGRNKKYLVFFQLFLASIFASFIVLGSKAMNDFPGYIQIYQSIGQHAEANKSGFGFFEDQLMYILAAQGGFEPGFIYLSMFFNFLDVNPFVFLWLISLITNFLIFRFIYQFPRPLLSLFFLICTQLFFQQGNLIRQMLAISILFQTIPFILKRQFWKFLLVVLLAASFHVGSLLFVFIYMLLGLKIKRHFLILIWIFSILVFYFPSIIPLESLFQVTLFAKNLTHDNNVGDLVYFNVLYNVILFIFLITKLEDNDLTRAIFLIFFLGVSLGNFVAISEWFYRISLYFLLPVVILLSSIDKPLKSLFNFHMDLGKFIVFLVLFVFLSCYPIRFSLSPDSSALGSKWFGLSELKE